MLELSLRDQVGLWAAAVLFGLAAGGCVVSLARLPDFLLSAAANATLS